LPPEGRQAKADAGFAARRALNLLKIDPLVRQAGAAGAAGGTSPCGLRGAALTLARPLSNRGSCSIPQDPAFPSNNIVYNLAKL
jgi:hypothetical protein